MVVGVVVQDSGNSEPHVAQGHSNNVSIFPGLVTRMAPTCPQQISTSSVKNIPQGLGKVVGEARKSGHLLSPLDLDRPFHRSPSGPLSWAHPHCHRELRPPSGMTRCHRASPQGSLPRHCRRPPVRLSELLEGRAPGSAGGVRRRIRRERRRSHPAAHVGRILSGGNDGARCLPMVGCRPHRDEPTLRSGRPGPWPGCSGEDIDISVRPGSRQLSVPQRSILATSRRPDDQIGLGHIQPGIKETGGAPGDGYVSRVIVNSMERPEWTVCASGSPPRIVPRSPTHLPVWARRANRRQIPLAPPRPGVYGGDRGRP